MALGWKMPDLGVCHGLSCQLSQDRGLRLWLFIFYPTPSFPPQKGSLHPSLYLALSPLEPPSVTSQSLGRSLRNHAWFLAALSQNHLFSQANL